MKKVVGLVSFLFVSVNCAHFLKTHPRWNIFPNGHGRVQIMDLNQPQSDPEAFFNPLQDIQFHLFTRRNSQVSQRITFDMNTVRNSNWNSANSVRFIIHGHDSDRNAMLNTLLTEQYLLNADHNVVVVDWSAGSNTRLFSTARGRVGTAGGVIALFIDDLHRGGLINLGTTMIVGHNLGAHVAGNAGKQTTRGVIGAIIGLDAAVTNFNPGDADRLSNLDAQYTENIHTNGGGNGFADPITRASFYPNWGSSQPGCGIDLTGNCAHERSILFYAESITSSRFIGTQCANYQQIVTRHCPGTGITGIMGGDAVKNLSGVFFLGVNAVPPFAQN